MAGERGCSIDPTLGHTQRATVLVVLAVQGQSVVRATSSFATGFNPARGGTPLATGATTNCINDTKCFAEKGFAYTVESHVGKDLRR